MFGHACLFWDDAEEDMGRAIDRHELMMAGKRSVPASDESVLPRAGRRNQCCRMSLHELEVRPDVRALKRGLGFRRLDEF